MAYVLQASQFAEGLQSYTALLLESIRQITLVSPFNVPDARTALELNQITTFSDAGFDQYLTEIYSLDLDYSLLTAAEITVLNVIRAYLEPPPSFNCCGVDAPSILNYTKQFNDRIGSATWEKEVRLALMDTVTCDVFNIEATFVAVTPGAPVLVDNPFFLTNLGCINGESVYSYLWIDFASNPGGYTYDLDFDFKDSTGASIVVVADSITF
tara:strand:- start:70 stop:705 length:636 start_codon:yes stop_codon:yes gene_type:complete